MSLFNAFKAGKVRRWHSNPVMCHVIDPIDAHSGRVARIIAMLHQRPSPALLIAALIHDDGEIGPGDMCGQAKKENPDLAAMLEPLEQRHREEIWGNDPALDEADRQWLKFADRLDAYMVAQWSAPHIMGRDGWPQAKEWLLYTSSALGCRSEVAQLFSDMDGSQ